MADNDIIMRIWQKIEEYASIIIYGHRDPDYDSRGSSHALREIILSAWPDKEVYLAEGKTGRDLSLIPRADVMPAEDKLSDSLGLVLDTSSIERISCPSYSSVGFIIKIDHHRDFAPFGDISWVDTEMAAVCQMVLSLYEVGRRNYSMKLSSEAAKYLFCGMITDSGCFRFLNRDQAPRFYEAMKQILYHGDFDPASIIRSIFQSDAALVRLSGRIRMGFERPIEELVYFKVEEELLKTFGLTWREAGGMVNNLMGITGVRVWALFLEDNENGRILCEFRSSEAKVNLFAYRFGGGGHDLASGCTAADWQEVDVIIAALTEFALQE